MNKTHLSHVSKQSKSAQNYQALKTLLQKAHNTQTWTDYGSYKSNGAFAFNRTKVATDCGFARSAFSVNPDFKTIISHFETLASQHKRQDNSHKEGLDHTRELDKPTAHKHTTTTLARQDKEIYDLQHKLALKTTECENLRLKLYKARQIIENVIPQGKRTFPGDFSDD
jgi:chromosome segregation ATPase